MNLSTEVSTIFEEALQRSPEERDSFLADRCNGDHQTREIVERLLAADQKNEDSLFLEWPDESVNPAFRSQWIGRRLGSYEITKYLGGGSTGLVFLANVIESDHISLPPDQEQVAIKILRSWQQDSVGFARFMREAEALSRISHPSIAHLIEVGKCDDGVPFIVMPYLAGESLQAQASRVRSFPLRTRMKWFSTICRAIAFAHQELVIHRDLKPSNIIITSDREGSRAVVTDLGTAKFVGPDDREQVTATGSIIGTPEYMAPEQIDGSQHVTLLTDIYGLGGVLYFLLTGNPPFSDDSAFGLLTRVKKETVVRPTQLDNRIPHDLETICLKCLAKEPEHRYQSVPELIAEVERWAEGKAILANPLSWFGKTRYWCKRNPHLAFLYSMLFTLLMGSSLTFLLLWQNATAAQQKAEKTNAELRKWANSVIMLERSFRDKPANTPLRRDLLAAITSAFEELETGGPLETDMLELSATAWYNFARFDQKLTGKFDEKSKQKALQQFSELARRHPEKLKYQFDLFHCHLLFRNHDEALKTITRLVEVDPSGNLDYRGCLAATQRKEAERLIQNGEINGAFSTLTDARSILLNVIDESPEQRKLHFKFDLGHIQQLRARILFATNQPKAARKELQSAVELHREVFEGNPLLGTRIAYCDALLWQVSFEMFDQNWERADQQLRRLESLARTLIENRDVYCEAWGLGNRVKQHRWMLSFEMQNQTAIETASRDLERDFERWLDSGVFLPSRAYNLAGFILNRKAPGYLEDFARREKTDLRYIQRDANVRIQFLIEKGELRKAQLMLRRLLAESPQGGVVHAELSNWKNALEKKQRGEEYSLASLSREQWCFLMLSGNYRNVFAARQFKIREFAHPGRD